MRTKNTKELKLRAASHVKYDHIKQGTYGQGKVNGYAEFKGCAIGCLSTPHRKAELRSFLRQHLETREEALRQFEGRSLPKNYEFTLKLDDEYQRKRLGEEFGLTRLLVIAAEALFEAQRYHGDAINFVRNFAYAIPEGVEITDREVWAFLKDDLCIVKGNYRPKELEFDEISLYEEVAHLFLTWIEEKGPKEAVEA